MNFRGHHLRRGAGSVRYTPAIQLPDRVAIRLNSEAAAEDVRAAVRAGLNEFNFAHSPVTDVRPVVFAARDPDGTLMGGLVGELRPGWKWLYIAMRWIAAPYRLQRIGERLMRAAEREARQQGCEYAAVDTISFQARGFYEKQGYTVWGVQEDYPPGHCRFYFSKRLV
jgi:GNAT superfamily N-acetyltransferase